MKDGEKEMELPRGSAVLVTGATGYTGRRLVQKLTEAGADVRAVARPSSNLEPLRDLPIRWFLGDVFDEETIRAAMEGVEYVFHVAAAFREPKSTERDYWNVHAKSTQLLAAAAIETARIQAIRPRFDHGGSRPRRKSAGGRDESVFPGRRLSADQGRSGTLAEPNSPGNIPCLTRSSGPAPSTGRASDACSSCSAWPRAGFSPSSETARAGIISSMWKT
jgi:hypothetical protein